MTKKWQYFEDIDEEEIKKLQNEFKINKMIAGILVSRGITCKKAKITSSFCPSQVSKIHVKRFFRFFLLHLQQKGCFEK